MARNDQRNGVVPHRATNSLSRLDSHLFSNVAVGHCGAVGNGKQDFPHSMAEGTASHYERRREVRNKAAEIRVEPTASLLKNKKAVAFYKLVIKRFGKVLLPIKP